MQLLRNYRTVGFTHLLAHCRPYETTMELFYRQQQSHWHMHVPRRNSSGSGSAHSCTPVKLPTIADGSNPADATTVPTHSTI